MRIESGYPAPTLGVSTLAEVNRERGLASEQVNFQADPVRKLRRRPSSEWVARLAGSTEVDTDNVVHHMYIRDDQKFELLLDKTSGDLLTFVDGVYKTTLSVTSSYLSENMIMRTIGHETFVINRDKEVSMGTLTDYSEGTAKAVSYLNLITAPDYEDVLGFTIMWPSDGGVGTYVQNIEIQIVDEADTNGGVERAVASITSYLESTLDLEHLGLYLKAEGSAVAFYTTNVGSDGSFAVTLTEREDYDTDSFVLFNTEIDEATNLPESAIPNSVIKVVVSETSASSTYYIKAYNEDGGSSMEEVTWVETRAPDEPYNLNNATLPHRCIYSDGTFTLVDDEWKDRERGDDVTNPAPDFVGRRIANVGYCQGRLVLLAEDFVLMSETNDVTNFWLQSAVTDYDTDPISITSSETDTDNFAEITTHDRDVLIFTSNSQFKIDNSTALSPSNASIAKTTSYDCVTDVRPGTLGNAIVFPVKNGAYVGLHRYFIDSTTDNDFGSSLTSHVETLMKGTIEVLATSSNNEIVVIKTSDEGNVLFVYEQYSRADSEILQRAWSKWELPESYNVLNILIKNGIMYFAYVENNEVHTASVNLFSSSGTVSDYVHLDNQVTLSTDGTTVELDSNYVTTDMVVVGGEGTSREKHILDYTLDGTTLTLHNDIGAGEVYIGRVFTSKYVPTRPFIYEDGIVSLVDRLSIVKFALEVINSHELHMDIVSDYYDTVTQTFNSRIVGGLNNKLGSIPSYTGRVVFPFGQVAEYAIPEFYVNNHLSCTIAKIEWTGKYNKASRRV